MNHENQSSTEIYINNLTSYNIGFIYHKQEKEGFLPEQKIMIKENRPELLAFHLHPLGAEYDVDSYVLTNLKGRKESFSTNFWKEFDAERVGFKDLFNTTFEKSLHNGKKRPHEWVSVSIDYTYDRFMQYNRLN